MHAIIVGAGIGGISAALFLLKAGVRVSLLERAEELKEVGAGVQISSNGAIALRELGLLNQIESIAVKPKSFKVLHFETDELVTEFPLGEPSRKRYGENFFQLHRADLLDILVGALPKNILRNGAKVERVSQQNSHVTAVLSTGEKIDADFLVGADGIHSTVRSSLGLGKEPTFSGKIVWRALVPYERVIGCDFDESFYGYTGRDRMVWGYWVRPNSLFNFGGVVPASEVRQETWTESGNLYEMLESFEGANPRLQILLDSIDEAFITGLYDRDPLDLWTIDRATLLGDSAHPMLPYLAQGACQSLEDSVVLAECIQRHGPNNIRQSLLDYEIRRRPRTTKVQSAARAAAIYWLENNPEQIRARDGRMRGLRQIDPLATTMWQWLYGYDPLAGGRDEQIKPDKRGIRRIYQEDSTEQKRAWNEWHDLFTNADEAGGLLGLRDGYDRFFGQWQADPNTTITEEKFGLASGLWVDPSNVNKRRAILHLHGGGFCFGSAKSSLEYAERLAKAVNARCLVLEYRLAPEHPFPASLEDTVFALSALGKLYESANLFLSGESAGVALAIAATMKLRELGRDIPASILALSPFVDCTLASRSIEQRDGEDPIVERDTLTFMVSNYFQDNDPRDPFVSPIFGDFTGLPPILIQAGKKEVLVDEALRLAKRAKASNVDTTLELFDERLHIFSMFPYLPNAKDALKSVERFTNR